MKQDEAAVGAAADKPAGAMVALPDLAQVPSAVGCAFMSIEDAEDVQDDIRAAVVRRSFQLEGRKWQQGPDGQCWIKMDQQEYDDWGYKVPFLDWGNIDVSNFNWDFGYDFDEEFQYRYGLWLYHEAEEHRLKYMYDQRNDNMQLLGAMLGGRLNPVLIDQRCCMHMEMLAKVNRPDDGDF